MFELVPEKCVRFWKKVAEAHSNTGSHKQTQGRETR